MVKKVFNWVILAPGNIARKFATELQQLDNARIYAVGSRNAERANEFAKSFGAERAYDNYNDLVVDPEVDIIYIASPHAFHVEHALLCLNHKKPVLCEKALGINQSEVELMVKSARENGVFFMEAFFTPHQPSYIEAKKIIDSGELGKVKYIQGWFGFNKSPYDNLQRLLNPKLGGGALLDIGLYPVFDTLYFWGNPIRLLQELILLKQALIKASQSDSIIQMGYQPRFMPLLWQHPELEPTFFVKKELCIYGD